MHIEPVSNGAPNRLISAPKQRLHLNSCRSSNGTPSRMARKEGSQSRPTHWAGTKVATVEPACQKLSGTYVPEITDKYWCRKEDYSALRASPLRGRPAGAQIGFADLSNRLFVCQGFELSASNPRPRGASPHTL